MKHAFLFIISVSLVCAYACHKSTEPQTLPQGSIAGNVFNAISYEQPFGTIHLTMGRVSASQGYVPMKSTQASASGQYSFISLDTGFYYVSTDTNSYVKTGYVEFVTLTPSSLHPTLDVPFDTVVTRHLPY